ncbi:MAG: methyl-accepting chemotaxis protein [Planctomycetota bacterium]
MSIKLKLSLLAAVPLLVIAVMGARIYQTNARVAAEMQDLSVLSDLAVHLSAMVHETQKERGRTAGFLGSQGKKFSAELGDQRELADTRIEAVRGFLEDFDPTDFDQAFQDSLAAALADLDRIDATRQAVSAMSIPAGQAIGYYTAMNGRFLDAIGVMSEQSRDADLTRSIAAYVHFLKGKERAGIERAVLSNTFAADQFGPGMYRKFIALVTEQDTYFTEFQALASPEAMAYFDQASADPAFGEVQGYRDVAFARADTGGFGADAGVWFSIITAKINKLKETEDFLSAALRSDADQAAVAAVRAQVVVGGVTLLIVVLGVLGALLTTRSITRPLTHLVTRIHEIQSSNNLTLTVDHSSKDEIGQLAQSFNEFVTTLRHIIGQVHQSSEEVAAAATEVAACSEQLSTGMHTQSGQMNSISAAVEEMSASVVEVARQASDASTDADQAGGAAREGQDVVQQTVAGMQTISDAVTNSARAVTELGKRGEQIGEIIAVINDIADQTNLLALNAAIEAARAGEHGRGFAVVADEVRKLADRTTQATDEISASITAIQQETGQAVARMDTGTQQVSAGVESATQAGRSLQQIVDTSNGLAHKVQSIAAAAEEQSAAAQEVAMGLESINSVASESLEGTRQAAEASEHLSRRAEDLRELVSRFDT